MKQLYRFPFSGLNAFPVCWLLQKANKVSDMFVFETLFRHDNQMIMQKVLHSKLLVSSQSETSQNNFLNVEKKRNKNPQKEIKSLQIKRNCRVMWIEKPASGNIYRPLPLFDKLKRNFSSDFSAIQIANKENKFSWVFQPKDKLKQKFFNLFSEINPQAKAAAKRVNFEEKILRFMKAHKLIFADKNDKRHGSFESTNIISSLLWWLYVSWKSQIRLRSFVWPFSRNHKIFPHQHSNVFHFHLANRALFTIREHQRNVENPFEEININKACEKWIRCW